MEWILWLDEMNVDLGWTEFNRIRIITLNGGDLRIEKGWGCGSEEEKKIKNSLLVSNKVSLSSNSRQICCRMGDMNIEKDDRQQRKPCHQRGERWLKWES